MKRSSGYASPGEASTSSSRSDESPKRSRLRSGRFVSFRESKLPSLIKLVYVSLAFAPRLALYGLVFVLGQVCRALAKLFCSSVGAPHAANKRILYVSDYMPPQCHGIALRVSEYTKHLRQAGHEVHVYTCCVESRARTSFDHPTLPYVANPFNSGNQISYSVGVKLAWALGAESWDVVHVFYPNCLGLFVLPACRWRGVASYCSHHVSMDEYAKRYVDLKKWPFLQEFCLRGYSAMYDICYRLPASYWGDVNSSMTRTFVNRHLPLAAKYSHVATIGSGVDVERFARTPPLTKDHLGWLWVDYESCDSEREALCKRIGASHKDPETRIWVMVQRLAPEKDTHVALEALQVLKKNPRSFRKTFLVIAGDGPARDFLEKKAKELFFSHADSNNNPEDNEPGRVTFLGAVKNERLPSLYRAADLFITCSRSETFGLTVTEALASGSTVALPRCAVFDELYGDRLPKTWLYDAEDPRGAAVALLDAVQAATSPEARAWLAKNPIDASWKAASDDLDRQYDDAIQRGRTKYTNVRQYVQKRLIHLGRASLFAVSLYYILTLYYRSFYCHLTECHLFLPSLPISVRAVCLFTLVFVLEWCHC